MDSLEADGFPPLLPIMYKVMEAIITAHPVLVGARPACVNARWLEVLAFYHEMLAAADKEGESCRLKRPCLLPLCKIQHRSVTIYTAAAMIALHDFAAGMPQSARCVPDYENRNIEEIGRTYFAEW